MPDPANWQALSRFGFELCSRHQWNLSEAVPVFHRWIQRQSFPDHLLIDVHDYRHVEGGPGVLLVGHEGNLSLSLREGDTLLQYYRKRPQDVPLQEGLRQALRAIVVAANRLISDLSAAEWSRQRLEWVFFSNDRLLAPNRRRLEGPLGPFLTETLTSLFNQPVRLKLKNRDLRARLCLHIEFPESPDLKDLLVRLESVCCPSG